MSARGKTKVQVQRLVDERDRLLAEITALRNQVQGIERAIALLEPTASAATTSGKPVQVKSTLFSFLREVGTTGLTQETVMEMAGKRGIALNKGTVASTLSRLKKDEQITYDGQRYRLPEFSQLRPVSATFQAHVAALRAVGVGGKQGS